MRVLKNMSIGQAIFPMLILGTAALVFVPVAQGQALCNSMTAPVRGVASQNSAAMPSVPGTLSAQQIRELIQKVAANDIENDKKQRDYTYTERDVEHNLDGKGRLKSTDTETYDVLNIYGEQVQRLIEKNDKPVSAKEAAKQEEKIQKRIDKREHESDKDRAKREEREAKDREEDRQFEREIADAYNFTLLGTEQVDGRDAWVISAEPRPGFVPHMKYANYLPKFHGRIWIDKADVQMSKLDVEALDTVSWGLFLARFHKGSQFMIEQARINNEVWLPRKVDFSIGVRLAMLKNFNVDVEQTFRDYKKFRADSNFSLCHSEPAQRERNPYDYPSTRCSCSAHCVSRRKGLLAESRQPARM